MILFLTTKAPYYYLFPNKFVDYFRVQVDIDNIDTSYANWKVERMFKQLSQQTPDDRFKYIKTL